MQLFVQIVYCDEGKPSISWLKLKQFDYTGVKLDLQIY